ncbi:MULTISPECIES: low molecular weight protein-tyrosine-phosphatase [unclassified Alcanivorax]|jgi:protein-tyrosine phosphatase|uniref:low molecular weight protein-tyrosine-phosphatase n=1 Tax=unclassified Alcanivorax TaxID=2638842 RepID=UPI0008A02975|nr:MULTISPECIES: low molecular weight protein-tyrosine-phosphatase [unclassified Alcanivorax]MEE2604014.1 low molecular weight protein-tyrosine-phosphatase [Pseudomonadota bacterium]MEE3389075.1 low molecular weight protein-tyrosine-phosphatase [Pseudomonadota bacterium]SEF38714.1 protein tyrosine phosphatase [Alcanivorax sp. DSM 26293]
MTVSVLFVCLGNICRSPTAEAVFRERVIAAGLEAHIRIDSAGTGDWHIGRAPDPRTREAAARRGYQMDTLRARQVSPQDFYEFDVVLAMDNTNLADLQAMQPADVNVTLGRFLDYSTAASVKEVPDPYYGGEDGFDRVLDLIEGGADGLLDALRERL